MSRPPTVIVVCDTNVFVHDSHLLRSKEGQDLLRMLPTIHARLFLPGILCREYVERVQAEVRSRRDTVGDSLTFLSSMVGRPHGLALPDDDAVKQDILTRLQELGSLTMDEPISDELLIAAAHRSMDRRPPNSKSDHAYKDCLIWESILRLQPGSEVHFVTKDKPAFFVQGKFSPHLAEEARKRDISVAAYGNLGDLLAELKSRSSPLALARLDASDVLDTSHEVRVLPPVATVPSTPASGPPVPGAETRSATGAVAAGDASELKRQLADARGSFEAIDLRVLGFLSYIDASGKEQLFRMLSQAGIPVETARNVIERLVITQFVRDTGNHYLIADRNVGVIAGALVEAEIIALLEKGS